MPAQLILTPSLRFFGSTRSICIQQSKFANRYLRRYLRCIFFIEGSSFGNIFTIYHGGNSKKATAIFHSFINGFKLQRFTVLIGPAVQFVFMIYLEQLQLINKHMWQYDIIHYPLIGFLIPFIKINGAY